MSGPIKERAYRDATKAASRNGLINFGPSPGWLVLAFLLVAASAGGLK